MKWFQHSSDSYTDFKHQSLIDNFGMEGYGFFWLCCEIVAQQGKNYRLKDVKMWKSALKRISLLPEEKITSLLFELGELKLISGKSLQSGVLYIPKMGDYSDDYTKRVRRVSEHSSESVRQDKKRVDKIRIEENKKEKPPTTKNELTPKEQAEKFFTDPVYYQKLARHFIDEKHYPRVFIDREFKKFHTYWTEKNGAGTKQKWQPPFQKTFEIQKRLNTWIIRSQDGFKK